MDLLSEKAEQKALVGRVAIYLANGLMLVLFVWAAVMQYNDPDSLLWISIYGAAALCCILYMAGRLPALLAVILSGMYTLGTLYLLLQTTVGPIAFFDETGNEMMGMMEESREMLGLFLAAAWTGFLAWWVHRSAVSQPVSEQPEATGP